MYELMNKDILHFRFKKLKSWLFFISNDFWDWLKLTEQEFNSFISWNWLSDELKKTLMNRWFMRHEKLTEKENIFLMACKWASRYHYLFAWPQLHLIVVWLLCNHSCLYCHASSKILNNDRLNRNLLMDEKIAKKTVDTIFESSSWFINIEFQWWEPLINWDIIKYIIEYAKEKNKDYNLHLKFSLVSNLTLMDDEKMKYLVDNNIWISTSLDWDEDIHNYNRKMLWWKSSWKLVTDWIKKISDYAKKQWKENYKVSPIATVTKYSLKNPNSLVDTYISVWATKIFVRPLNPYWFAKNVWDKIWYEQEEYVNYYDKLLDYITLKQLEWVDISDSYYDICHNSMRYLERVAYTEEMSPFCWAVLTQVAYNYDGWIYSCDEWRMMHESWDDSFKIWQIDLDKRSKDIYKEYCLNYVSRILLFASMIDFVPWYNTHPYSSFIWLCPIYAYVTNWNIVSKYKKDARFTLQQWVFNRLIEKDKL